MDHAVLKVPQRPSVGREWNPEQGVYLRVVPISESVAPRTRRWVKDGTIYTSVGVTAGIDLALALVEEDVGSRIALQIARSLVVFLKRPGGQRQFSAPLAAQTPSTKSFVDLIAWIAENLHKPLSVEMLAERMSMSPRNFARVFRVETGATPATYIRRARIESVRTLLEQSKRGLEDSR